jgi:hypothetical protein
MSNTKINQFHSGGHYQFDSDDIKHANRQVQEYYRASEQARDAEETFWQEFDEIIIDAVSHKIIPRLREEPTRGGRLRVVISSFQLYLYQLDLLQSIIDDSGELPFRYETSQHYLNRYFFSRQRVASRAYRQGEDVCRGVELVIPKVD